jgi:hypothetical protein
MIKIHASNSDATNFSNWVFNFIQARRNWQLSQMPSLHNVRINSESSLLPL